jgi:signal peptidase I
LNKKKTIKWLGNISFLLIAFALLFVYPIRIAEVSGRSMEPTLSNGDRYLFRPKYDLNGFTNIKNFNRFDIVIIQSDKGRLKEVGPIVKRVIGTPGDRVKMTNDVLYINDQIIEQNFDFVKTNVTFLEIQLNNNQYFVMGDNRPASYDSREFGPIEKEYIIGKSYNKKI